MEALAESAANMQLAALETGVRRAQALLDQGQVAHALTVAETLLVGAPESRDLLYLAAVAQRQLNRIADALGTLARLETGYPTYGRLFQERAHCQRMLGNPAAALATYRRAVAINDTLSASWMALQQLYRASGQTADAAEAARCLARLAALPPAIVRASDLLNEGEVGAAEQVVREFLQTHGSHIDGMRLLAQIAIKHDVLDDAELLLENVVKLAPDYHDARYEYAAVLSKRRRYLLSFLEAQKLLQVEPENRTYRLLYAQACDGLGEYDEALRVYRRLAAESPDDAALPLLIAHALKTSGRAADAVQSFRVAVALPSSFAGAFHGLSNMKTYRFADDEIARMRIQESAAATTLADRYHLCFALGNALEARAEYAESFHYYERGNALKRGETPYNLDLTERNVRLQAAVCTPEFFAARQRVGCSRADPIFIVGLPRSGSTLIEQILASHSLVDGTLELPDIPMLVQQFRDRKGSDGPPRYPGVLAELHAEEFELLGRTYLQETRVYRRGAPFFIDKLPGNFREIGFIHLILPNARIIDARRDPMACGFGNFKQLFPRGQEFSYGLEDIGHYYRSYVELMDHWDRVLPGKVLRVRHEDVVADLAGSVRRMLEFCGLGFEPACLEFYKTARSVRTVSSEQVRRPIYRDGIDQWRRFEAWLGPLKAALGPLAAA
jgi:tetratricopeptide (TPR) repeat protein